MEPYLEIQDLSLLLVEPSDMQKKVIAKALEESGIKHIEFANNIAETLALLDSFPPDLIISAMYLPDGTANELIDAIRNNEKTEDQCFMLVSSESNENNLGHLRQAGVLAILPKPFNNKDLTRAIYSALDFIIEDEINLDLFDPRRLEVLVVDDSLMSQKYVSRTLNSMGIEQIQLAENGQEAIDMLYTGDFDLIITDYNMPEMDGRELARAVRHSSELAHIPILMVSSNAGDSKLANITQEGVDAICGKPFEPKVIRQLLTQILN
ncbi:response regulator [Marinomonas pollencensis]|uniref:Two-component system chemotaxis response regulator CheY n=1 Tax=Marinomonas pollencensis TaxID=491954 RepID=A0A3E0DKJ4_9GAMM|nr:response regulator [Marinomonas pollencensis]REG83274.1 two-component system chemotaxis response regulator CheY [Marinomonas pollencensis]